MLFLMITAVEIDTIIASREVTEQFSLIRSGHVVLIIAALVLSLEPEKSFETEK